VSATSQEELVMKTRMFGMIGVAGAAAALLAACSSGYGATGTTSANPPAPATSAGAAGAVATTSADLSTAQTSLGTVLVDSKGRTVYLFTQDSSNPPKSTCDTGCDSVWPPVTAPSGTPKVSGVDSAKVGTVTRSDGSKQLTYNGWPLYEYQGDSAAGDVKGENVQGSWFAVSSAGTKVTSAGTSGGSTPSSDTQSSGGGYGSGGGW
jgi:predicted lipoprotein with Yx(FWY)xxD motif